MIPESVSKSFGTRLRRARAWTLGEGRYLILSIGIACMLWGYLNFEKSVQVNVPLDLRWSGVPESRMVLSGDLPQIRVMVDGPGTLLRQIESRSLVYEIQADDLQEGTNLVRIDVARLKLPRGVIATRVSPSSFEVDFVAVEQRVLPVKVIFQGNIPDGYRLGGITRTPKTVSVTSRSGQLDGAQFLFTRPLSLTAHNVTFTTDIGLDLAGLDVKNISAQTVSVRVEIRPEIGEQTYKSIPVEIRGDNVETLESIPDQVTVVLSGPMARLRELEGLVQVWVEVPGVLSKPTPLLVQAKLPTDVNVVSITPKLVVVGEKRD